MEKLKNSKVFRAGQTARTWNPGTNDVNVEGDPPSRLVFQFDLSSKGGGVTQIKLDVGTKDFPALLAAMVSADRDGTLLHMATTLANELRRQPECDRATARSARESVLEAADDALLQAPRDLKNVERHVHSRVRQWVRQLNDGDAAKATE